MKESKKYTPSQHANLTIRAFFFVSSRFCAYTRKYMHDVNTHILFKNTNNYIIRIFLLFMLFRDILDCPTHPCKRPLGFHIMDGP